MLYHCHLSQGQNYKLFNYKIIFHEPNYLGLSFWWFTRGFLAGNFHKLKIEKFKLNWKMLTDKVGVAPILGKVWIVYTGDRQIIVYTHFFDANILSVIVVMMIKNKVIIIRY